MLAETNNNLRGNVVNQKSEDNSWYLKLIRNPNISSNAKIVFLNLRTNGDNYNENIKGLMFKCNLSEKSVSNALKELETLKILTRIKKRTNEGKYVWLYFTHIEMLPSTLYDGMVNHGMETERYKYREVNKINKVSTKEKKESLKNSEKEKITHSLSEKTKKEIKIISEEENVENSIIEFANKAEEEKIKNELENLANTLEINTQLKEFRYLILNTKKIRNTKPFDLIIEQIKTLPEYLNASSKKFPEQKYTKSQNLNYLSTILENPKGDYPKWFNDIEKNKVIETKKDEWKEFIKIWDRFSVASTQKDSLNLIISHLMIFIIESKKPESKYYNGLKNYTEDSLRKSLKIKSLDEIMEMINSQIKEQNGASTTFKKDTKDFFLNGFTIDSIKDLFKSIEV